MHSASQPVVAPLVEPGPELSAEQRVRASRQLALPGFDEIAQRRLAAARVLVVGAGGLGSASIPYLAGSGVGTIGIVDDDVVELSNLHRQVSHGTADVGRAKVDSLAETVRALDPVIQIIPHRDRLTSENALEVFANYDLVIDGSDNFPTRYLVDDAAHLSGIPLVWGAILRTHGQVGLAWHEHGPGYRDLFPAPPGADDALSCVVGGVLPGLCGTIGSLLATEALKVITGVGELLIGKVVIYDAMRVSFREIAYDRAPDAAPITELIDYELFCNGPAATGAAELTRTGPEENEALAAALRNGAGVTIIDVRSPEEYLERRVRGAELMPLPDLEAGATFAGSGSAFVICERGPRSERAAAILAERGLDVTVVSGGTREFAERFPDLIVRGTPA